MYALHFFNAMAVTIRAKVWRGFPWRSERRGGGVVAALGLLAGPRRTGHRYATIRCAGQ
jgi:hypothetical protein